MSESLAASRALVVGAGRGIGRASALALAEAGATVALAARSTDQLKEVRDTVEQGSGRAHVFSADVIEPGAPERLVAEAREALGGLDVLVNAAGTSPVYARAEQLEVEDWDAVLATNLRAAFLLCRAAGIAMLEQRRGSIVNIASIGAAVALPRLAAYCASKAGLVALTRVLAVEWADRGVRVNAVAPGYVRTEMTAGILEHPSLGRELVAQTPLGRVGEPEDVAGAVVYLASDAAAYVTGQTLYVDGGWTAR